MSLAYGIDGEIELELENNYGHNYGTASKEDIMGNLNHALRNMLSFMDDPSEKKIVKGILKSETKKKKIVKEFIASHPDYVKQ